jgi:quercetin 2,3-dioxygenase
MTEQSAVHQETSERRRVVWAGAGMAAQDGAGVTLTRIIGQPRLPDLDPFLMLDEFGSNDPDAYIAGFPDHPHRGFETVTYMLAGAMRHRDNKGNVGLLGPGSIQWMTAGRGIVHSEMPEQQEGLMRGFQLWINLPAKDKLCAPRYQDIAPELVPRVPLAPGVEAKVLVGEIAGTRGPVEGGATQPLYFDLAFAAGSTAEINLPAAHNGFVYVYEGALEIGALAAAQSIAKGSIAVLSTGEFLDLKAGPQGAQAILVAGRPLREPVAKYGPFVMNTQAEIQQAFKDFQAGQF